MDSNGLEIQV